MKNADQVGIIVADLEAFLQTMEELLGLKGFEVIEYPPADIEAETIYYGELTDFKVKMAFRDFGMNKSANRSKQAQATNRIFGRRIIKSVCVIGNPLKI